VRSGCRRNRDYRYIGSSQRLPASHEAVTLGHIKAEATQADPGVVIIRFRAIEVGVESTEERAFLVVYLDSSLTYFRIPTRVNDKL
jgi:hypothetical protein